MLKPKSALGLAGVIALLAVSVSACGSSSSRDGFVDPNGTDPNGTSGGTPPPGSIGSNKPATPDPAMDECQKMDIVFIVDDSGSMEQEQTNLAANFPKFVSVLDAYKTKSGAKLDYRLAITTTSRNVKYSINVPGLGSLPMDEKGDNGAFRNTKTCGGTQRWVDTNEADRSSAFSCRAKVGTSGSSIEMPLYALQLALNDRMADGTNAGFRRDDALLAFVVLTDEDDCSRKDDNFVYQGDGMCETMMNVVPLADFKTMLDTAAKGPGRWATAVIAGDTQCTSSFGDALEAKRLKSFVNLAGKNGSFSSICDGDLSIGLTKALDTFDGACKSFPAPVR